MVAVDVDDEGAALVVAVVVDAPVLLLVSVDALVVDDAEVSAVVELLVDVVVWPHAAIAARAPAAAKLKIKRMTHLSSRKMGRRSHRRSICQTPWRNLTNLKAAEKAWDWPILGRRISTRRR